MYCMSDQVMFKCKALNLNCNVNAKWKEIVSEKSFNELQGK